MMPLVAYLSTSSTVDLVEMTSVMFTKLSSLRAENEHGRWYKNSRLVTIPLSYR